MRTIRKLLCIAGCAALLMTGCGSENEEIYKQADLDLEKEHYDLALEGFQEAVKQDVHKAEAYRGMGIAQLKLGQYEDAVASFDEALSLEDGRKFQRDVLSYKCTAQYKSGDSKEALATCEQVEELGADAQCYYLMGRLQLENDQYEKAANSFDQAIDQDTTYDMYIDVFQAYNACDMGADGDAYLQRALEMKAKSEEDFYHRGRVYYFMKDYENAQKELLKSADEGYMEAKLFLGKVYLAQNDVANARAMYQQFLQEEGPSGSGYNGLALCDLAEGKYEDAMTNIRAGLDVAETEEVKDLMFNEIVAHERMQDFAGAKEKAEAYLQLFPDDEAAIKEFEFLKSRS